MNSLIAFWYLVRKNKYTITIALFTFIIVFVDENSMIRRMSYSNEISRLKEEIERYRKEYNESTNKLIELNSNPEVIEQIAREKYLMKKSNEDIYVFED